MPHAPMHFRLLLCMAHGIMIELYVICLKEVLNMPMDGVMLGFVARELDAKDIPLFNES